MRLLLLRPDPLIAARLAARFAAQLLPPLDSINPKIAPTYVVKTEWTRQAPP